MAKKGISKPWLILVLIVFLAAFLRFWHLAEIPPGFHIDEASLGYNAYSLLKTGRDENGNFLPLHTDMFGDFRPAGYRYLAILPIKFFGLTEFATRFPSTLFGTLTIIAIFLLTRVIFASSFPALITAGLLAVSPWQITFSRSASEANVALFFVVLGSYFFLSGITYLKRWRFFFASVLWGISMFVYHSPRVFVPALALMLVVFLKPLIKGSLYRSLVLSVLITIGLSLFLVFGSGGGTGRFQQVSIIHYPEIRLVLEEQIREDGYLGVPIILTRFFHNKIINYGLGFVKEYFRYFTPSFLFLEGGLPKWYIIPNMGLMYLIELPVFLVGIYFLLPSYKKRLCLVPLLWLLVAPLVAALTRDDVPNVLRSLIMLPALVMITGFGIWQVWICAQANLTINRRRLIIGIASLIFFWNFTYFLVQYFVHASVHQSWYRGEGIKEMVLEVNKRLSKYEKVLISKDETTYAHFLFFTPIDPALYQSWGSPRDPDYGGFGKLVFKPGYCPVEEGNQEILEENTLWVSYGSCPKAPFNKDKAMPIYRPDGTVAFWIYPK